MPSVELPRTSLLFSNAEIHGRAVNAVRNLLGNHDIDARFNKDPECKARVANLYLPLVGVVIDNMAKLYAWHVEGETRIAGTSNQNEHLTAILTAISDNVPNVRFRLATFSACPLSLDFISRPKDQ